MHGMERLKWIPNNNPPKCPARIGPVGLVSGVGVGIRFSLRNQRNNVAAMRLLPSLKEWFFVTR